MRNWKLFMSLALVLSGAALVEAVNLQPYGGGLQGTTRMTVTGQGAPFIQESSDIQSQQLNIYSEINNIVYASCNVSASYGSFSQCDKWMSDLHIFTNLTSNPSSSAMVSCTSKMTTANNDGKGYFLQVTGTDAGEKPGDQVTVNFTWHPSIYAGGIYGSTQIKGLGDADHFAIALNPQTPVASMPAAGEEVWTHANVDMSSAPDMPVMGSFTAHVGDIVGVFVEVSCQLDYDGSESRYLNCGSPFMFEVEIENNQADINKDGAVDLLDWQILASEWLWVRPGR